MDAQYLLPVEAEQLREAVLNLISRIEEMPESGVKYYLRDQARVRADSLRIVEGISEYMEEARLFLRDMPFMIQYYSRRQEEMNKITWFRVEESLPHEERVALLWELGAIVEDLSEASLQATPAAVRDQFQERGNAVEIKEAEGGSVISVISGVGSVSCSVISVRSEVVFSVRSVV